MKPTLFKWLLHGAGMATTLLVVIIAYAVVFRPMTHEASDLRATIAARSDFLEGAGAIRAKNDELKGSLAETEELIGSIKRRIPDTPREADFLAQLSDAATSSDVEIVDYRPAATVEKDNHYELTIQVSANGKYAGICQFLDQLQSLPRLCHITGMVINARDLKSKSYPVELTLQVFYRRVQSAMIENRERGNE